MSTKCPCCFKDILTWTNPKKTLISLVIFNFLFLFLNYLQISAISLIFTGLLYFAVYKLIKFHLFPSKNLTCNNTPCEIKQETITKIYLFIYDKLNRYIDEFRSLCLLTDKAATLRKLCLLIILRWISSFFSSATLIILIIDGFVLLHYGNMGNIVKETINTILSQIARIVNENIPKYSEPPKYE